MIDIQKEVKINTIIEQVQMFSANKSKIEHYTKSIAKNLVENKDIESLIYIKKTNYIRPEKKLYKLLNSVINELTKQYHNGYSHSLRFIPIFINNKDNKPKKIIIDYNEIDELLNKKITTDFNKDIGDYFQLSTIRELFSYEELFETDTLFSLKNLFDNNSEVVEFSLCEDQSFFFLPIVLKEHNQYINDNLFLYSQALKFIKKDNFVNPIIKKVLIENNKCENMVIHSDSIKIFNFDYFYEEVDFFYEYNNIKTHIDSVLPKHEKFKTIHISAIFNPYENIIDILFFDGTISKDLPANIITIQVADGEHLEDKLIIISKIFKEKNIDISIKKEG